MIGHHVPEGYQTRELVLKDLVQLLPTPYFTEESLCYLQSKILDHRQLLTVLPGKKSCVPSITTYIEHYPYLIQKFGPLIECWTTRFGAKHSLSKQVVWDANNFKNVLLPWHQDINLCWHITLKCQAISSQRLGRQRCPMYAFLLSSVRQAILNEFSGADTVGLIPNTFPNGKKDSKGMILSVGSTSGLPDFGRILEICIVLIFASILNPSLHTI